MVAQIPLHRSRHLACATPSDFTAGERETALAVSPHVERVHASVLQAVDKIFASSHDRRVINGVLFLAHFLRLATIMQLSLPNLNACDVAVVTLPSVLALCRDKKHYGWQWSYDTTCKYLALLVAAGIFSKPKVPRGQGTVYHFPLIPYPGLPANFAHTLQELTGKNTRKKVTRSLALKRCMRACTITPAGVDSSKATETVLVDSAEVQRSVQAIHDLLQRDLGVKLLPMTMQEIARILSEHSVRVMRKSRFFAETVDSSEQISVPSLRRKMEQQSQVVDSCSEESTISVSETNKSTKNLLSHPEVMLATSEESTFFTKNLPFLGEMVDSFGDSSAALTEFTITCNNKDSLSDRFSENTTWFQQKTANESPVSGQTSHEVDSSLTRASALHLTEEEITVQAAELSHRFSPERDRTAYYAKLLREDAEALRRAVVDTLVRSQAPDPGKRLDRLGGGWITRQYKRYHDDKEPLPVIEAWARTPYSLNDLEAILAEIAHRQDLRGQDRERLFPHDVIIDASRVHDFWRRGGGRGLEEQGYLYVDVEGALLSSREYYALRRRAVRALIEETELHDEVAQQEIEAYLRSVAHRICERAEEEARLARIPPVLEAWAQRVRDTVDPACDLVQILLRPLSQRYVIQVSYRSDPRQAKVLQNAQEVAHFLAHWEQIVARRVILEAGHSTDHAVIDIEENVPEQNVLQLGPYHIRFDEACVVIEQTQAGVLYHLGLVPDGNIVSFVQHYPTLLMALSRGEDTVLKSLAEAHVSREETAADV